MSYADKTYYRTTYIGEPCAVDTMLEKWLSRAADDINIYCFNGIVVDNLTAAELENLKKANCAQAENYVINGSGTDDYDSVSLGSFSYKKSADDNDRGGVLCERAARYLFAANLLNRSLSVCDRYRSAH